MVGDVKTEIFTDASGTILGQKTGNSAITFMYDATGRREGLEYNGTSYYYVYNAQGDIIGIVDSDLKTIVQYTYDAWGQPLKIVDGEGKDISGNKENIANLNPFRYRGYYYDDETGLNYLNSRYYDPVLSRFINADSVIAGVGGDVRGYNLFTYCMNDPINMTDQDGNWPSILGKLITNIVKNADNAVKKVVAKNAATNSNIAKVNTNKGKTNSYTYANFVKRSHITSVTVPFDGGPMLGKLGFSTTTMTQDKEPGAFYSFVDVGNTGSYVGVGTNAWGWLGMEYGISDEGHTFTDIQVTPWVHLRTSVGIDGVGAQIGYVSGDTTIDFDVKGGPLVLAAAMVNAGAGAMVESAAKVGALFQGIKFLN